VPSFDIRLPLDSPGVKFFEKFKHPDYELFSAFRLLSQINSNGAYATSRKEQIARKHRGNYRKYTVSEKE
jgi:hypothetical protein